MQPNGDGLSRMDRVERVLETLVNEHVTFQEEHKQLLKAQVVLTDRLDRFIKATTEAQKHTDERLNALIAVVDGIIRKQPPQQQ